MPRGTAREVSFIQPTKFFQSYYAIVSLIERPVAELYSNLSSLALVQQYFRDVGQLEENMVRRTSSI